ncbi:malto-oligosyltrehalose synthase [Antarcticibacterium flavum]|uniref:Malto-oligosyltrehalose synthase n=1 Tax=Antarcticibacterium flavum TaxID=2058175 RepID=A0A5B7X758_9FLAO|nr:MULTISPECIES: malto-oligosyltrehalose synthase [Antarcticibacterium]MCM4160317.1 malto-oligosyltrehalose synthase [Antarcticibacterium sp. W02-3]QCY67911.1 malto-oligosyltrehalose synthase [Antarcticibacterium flavum]QCY71304.1 malto-oligosyltrehalose synthase [Antarcticibacterium flavum]
MKKPDTTYRLQLSPGFTIEDLKPRLEYLHKLGISTIYSAPFFQAREGSTHGYDVIDPFTINLEIGTLEQFREIGQTLQKRNMTWLQDIVPNHMAYDGGNVWLKDIFELGPESKYYNFFDINWDYQGKDKVMAPFLGKSLQEVLEAGELKLQFDAEGFSLAYYDNVYPISKRSYSFMLAEANPESSQNFDKVFKEHKDWEDIKIALYRELERNPKLKEDAEAGVKKINSSKQKMEQLVNLQYYLPAHWKETEKEINYRRFFTINDLICLSMEKEEVFNAYHLYIKELCDAGLIQGLRIDHVDGLYDPRQYLQALRNLVGKDFYLIVEKILEAGEELPRDWPVEGTSGYDFLATVNHLFTNTRNDRFFSKAYEEISPKFADYEALVYEKKLFILKERMGGELNNLWDLLEYKELLPSNNSYNKQEWKEILSIFLAGFPVYRIYPGKYPLTKPEAEIIQTAYGNAVEHSPQHKEGLDYIRDLFLGKVNRNKESMLYFLQRCQQFTGPLAAKGVEDTSFYIYNRLVSHNEVGDSPENFGITIDQFHQAMIARRSQFPYTINATATHDTKRGEDTRMRLNVISEIPREWFEKVNEWKELNAGIRKNKKGPGANEEYFIYQTLLAGLPYRQEDDFLTRTCEYLQKVLREAKVHSNWAEPNEDYENDVFKFIEEVLHNDTFRKSFDPFQKKIAGLGAVKSLGQLLIKITSPGIPDIYQGTELWDLSFVDPDNRRPVDYDLRQEFLVKFENLQVSKDSLKELTTNFKTGEVKMYTMLKTLQHRRENEELFTLGEYIPLEVTGENSGNFVAFSRRFKNDYSLVVVPALVNELFDPSNLAVDIERIKDLKVVLSKGYPGTWKNIFTNEFSDNQGSLELTSHLEQFPVVLFKSAKDK